VNTGELQSILVVSGIVARVSASEVQIETCVFCGNDRWNLECNPDRGLYHCWTCKSGGRLDKLIKQLTGKDVDIEVRRTARSSVVQPPPAQAAFNSAPVSTIESAAVYLAQRGIDPQVAKQYGLVVVTSPEHRLFGRIAIPALDYWTGANVGWIGRSYTGVNPKYLSTMTAKQVIGWRNVRAPVVAVVEGSFDGIAVHRAGASAAVLAGTSSPDALAWASRLDPAQRVVVMLDPEASALSVRLYWELRQVLGSRISRVELVGGDPAELGPTALRQYLS
jgi:DNA primase